MFPFSEWYHKYPGTNFHELNIDELEHTVGYLRREFKEFKDVNQIKYMGEFDITKQYPIWSLVSDNNTGYIAIQNVPAGIALSNSDYWLIVADYSAALAGISSRVTDLENALDDLENDLENDLEDIEKKIKTNSSEWKNRKVLWVGDSYGVGTGSITGINPYDTAQDYLGCSGTNISVGYSRFGSTGDPGHHYLVHIQSYVSSHTDMDEYTDVIIVGGANDLIYNPTENLNDPSNPYSIYNTVEYVREHFPYAKIRIGMVARLIQSGEGHGTCTYENFRKVLKQYYEGAMSNGVEYIAGSELINHDYRERNDDAVHLLDYVPMGKRLAQLLLSGDFNRDTQMSGLDYDTTDVDQVPTTFNVTGQMHLGTNVILDVYYLAFVFGTPQVIPHDTLFSFAKISGAGTLKNLFAAGDKAFKIRLTANVKLDDDSIFYCPCLLQIYNNYMRLALDYSSASDYTVKEIHVPYGFQVTLDEAYC